MPTVVVLLKQRQAIQADEREGASEWTTHVYEGEAVSIIFTTVTGGLVLRQTVTKLVKQAAETAGIQAAAEQGSPVRHALGPAEPSSRRC